MIALAYLPTSNAGFSVKKPKGTIPSISRAPRCCTPRLWPAPDGPSLHALREGTLAMPGIIGAGDWGGTAEDPETGMLYVKATEEPSLLKLAPGDPERVVAEWDLDRTARMGPSVDDLSISDPPWGTLTAIDMNSGEHVWRVATGEEGSSGASDFAWSYRRGPPAFLAGLFRTPGLGNRWRPVNPPWAR